MLTNVLNKLLLKEAFINNVTQVKDRVSFVWMHNIRVWGMNDLLQFLLKSSDVSKYWIHTELGTSAETRPPKLCLSESQKKGEGLVYPRSGAP